MRILAMDIMSDKDLDTAIFREIAKGLTGRGNSTDLRELLDEWKRREPRRSSILVRMYKKGK